MTPSDFERKVLEGLNDCGVSAHRTDCLGVAVSGGADSVALLYSLAEISRDVGFALKVITVNHFMRPDDEACADAEFVRQCCESLKSQGVNLECEVTELGRGAVAALAGQRHGGAEDAARFLRYQAFEAFIKKHSLAFLCLAHNKNDQAETILMRFLQGGGADSLAGIARRRGFFVRPLLGIDRSDIEAYLRAKNIAWRKDSTNNDTAYLRNRIRHKLVPFLSKNFPGWQGAVLSGAEKSQMDAQLISDAVESAARIITQDSDSHGNVRVSVPFGDFLAFPDGIKIRLLLRMCNLLGFDGRIPHQFLKDVLAGLAARQKNQTAVFGPKRFANLEIYLKKERVFAKKSEKIHTDLVFFDIIRKKGIYDFPFGTLTADGRLVFNAHSTDFQIEFPFCVRNFCAGDEVLCADGKFKNVSDVFADWKVSEDDKPLIPLVVSLRNGGEIRGIFAEFLGYKDWIVK